MRRNITLLSIIAVILFYCMNTYSQITFQRTYGYGMMDMYSSIQETSDNGYIISGSSLADFWITFTGSVVKTLPNGDISWGKSYNGVEIDLWPLPTYIDDCNYMINHIEQTTDNGYILTGQVSPALLSLYVNYTDLCLLKMDASGGVTWSYRYGGTEPDFGNYVKQTSDGGYIVTGYTYSFGTKDSANIYVLKTNSSGVLSWDLSLQISAVDDDICVSVEEVSDGYIFAGYTEQVNGADTLADMVLFKTNIANNTIQWIKTYGLNADDERALDVSYSTASEVLVTGYTTAVASGLPDMLLMKVNNANGNINLSKGYYAGGLSVADEGHSIQNTSDGGILIVGFSVNMIGGMYSILLKTDNTGNTVALSQAYNNGFAGMQFFSTGEQTNDGGYVIGNMGPGVVAWDFGVIKTDANGISGCNEDTFTPTQETCSFTPEAPAYTTFSGSTGESFVAYVDDITITEGIICCSPLPGSAGAITDTTPVCQGQNGVTYTISPVTDATGYNWALPSGATIASGANTNSITVNFSVTASSGNITVYGVNDCGDGNPSSLWITVKWKREFIHSHRYCIHTSCCTRHNYRTRYCLPGTNRLYLYRSSNHRCRKLRMVSSFRRFHRYRVKQHNC
ncbi:MAG: hypothetical protein HY738_00785 [Bacteroidia bacterium]|nr:hypothetical protein [Bacteroidia bacterium]